MSVPLIGVQNPQFEPPIWGTYASGVARVPRGPSPPPPIVRACNFFGEKFGLFMSQIDSVVYDFSFHMYYCILKTLILEFKI